MKTQERLPASFNRNKRCGPSSLLEEDKEVVLEGAAGCIDVTGPASTALDRHLRHFPQRKRGVSWLASPLDLRELGMRIQEEAENQREKALREDAGFQLLCEELNLTGIKYLSRKETQRLNYILSKVPCIFIWAKCGIAK